MITSPNRAFFEEILLRQNLVDEAGKGKFGEQDVLNKLFHLRWKEIPPHYNIFGTAEFVNRFHRISHHFEIFHKKIRYQSDIPRALRKIIETDNHAKASRKKSASAMEMVPRHCWEGFVHAQFVIPRYRLIAIGGLAMCCFFGCFAALGIFCKPVAAVASAPSASSPIDVELRGDRNHIGSRSSTQQRVGSNKKQT
eukprot:jgi/Bigna1/132252/aug1.17_g6960